MNTHEINIANRALVNTITESELKALKSFLKTEENYSGFLSKLLSLVINKDTAIGINVFLELNHLHINEVELKKLSTNIIEDLAELTFKEVKSELANWLNETQNAIYLSHLTFLKQTQAGIRNTERAQLLKRIKSFEKINEFELNETEIQKGVTFLERRKLKKQLKELESNRPANLSKKRIKVSTVLILVFATSIVLAISIPQIRNKAIHLIQEMFNKDKENPESDSKVGELPAEHIDTIASRGQMDSIPKSSDSISAVTVRKTYPLFAKGKVVTIGTYRNHFVKHKSALEKIEGIWDFGGRLEKYNNPAKLKGAIRKIEDDKFELVFFSPNGILWQTLSTKYYLNRTEDPSKFVVTEFIRQRALTSKSAVLSGGIKIKLKASFLIEELNLKSEKANERALVNLTGSKEMLNVDLAH